MPFTPFHLGPGALFKAAGERHFSFMIFGGSQVLMDVEPLVRMINRDAVVHGQSHTVAGAFAIGLVSAVLGRPVTEVVLRLARAQNPTLTWRVAFLSAFIGTYSHILLDAIMHKDMHPLWPFASGNPMLGSISVGMVYVLCVVAGLIGITIMLMRGR
jgi:hypothetical protein